jgi:hypothetical protein
MNGGERGTHTLTRCWNGAPYWKGADLMATPTKDQIAAAVRAATGAPTVGPVAEAEPAIIEAVNALVNPAATEAKESGIIKAKETPEA